MAKNNIQNITATGSWQTVPNVPRNSESFSLQARTAADCYYRWLGQTTYWTVKSGHVRTVTGRFNPGEIEVQAANAVVIEIEFSTEGVMA